MVINSSFFRLIKKCAAYNHDIYRNLKKISKSGIPPKITIFCHRNQFEKLKVMMVLCQLFCVTMVISMTNFMRFLNVFQGSNMPMQRDFNNASPNITVDKVALRERLTPVEYQVTQEKSTERSVISTLTISVNPILFQEQRCAHSDKSRIFVPKFHFDKTLLLDIFEFSRQNWKICLNISS